MVDANKRETLAVLVKKTEQKFGGPSLAEFANDPPIRKHYAVADAILREFDLTPRTEGPQGEPSDARINEIQQWCPECHGSGMVMEFEPTDCPNLDLHRLLAAVTEVHDG